MSLLRCRHISLISVLSFIYIVHTVPPEYCLSPLNRSDCHMKPTPVFSYYKSGSRCEIQTWRGCPTANKFANEYHCSLHCLFRNQLQIDESKTDVTSECDAILNTQQCSNKTMTVFTHINGECIEATWGGCKTKNKFEDQTTCETTCHVVKKKIHDLDPLSLETILDLLESLTKEEIITDAPTTEVATTQPSTTEVATTQPSTTEVATTQPSTTEVAATQPSTTEASVESETESESPETPDVETTTLATETTTFDYYNEVEVIG